MSVFKTLPLLLDGATGTELQKRGMPAGSCTEKWVLEHPEALVELQRAYVAAGSQIVYAPTFGANRENLEKYGVSGDLIPEYCQKLVALSREAVSGTDVLVAGDIAPCGMIPEPYGDSTEEEIEQVFFEQAQALEAAGVDLYAVETQMNLIETLCALRAVKRASEKPVLVTFTCTASGRTLWGDDMTDALEECSALGIDAFGINCVGDLELLTTLLRELRQATSLPLIAKPNAGDPQMVNGKAVYAMTPEQLARQAKVFLEAGASILGGCCGTTPEHIAALKQALAENG